MSKIDRICVGLAIGIVIIFVGFTTSIIREDIRELKVEIQKTK